jgi:xylan 1,4-beta-xylosidase
MNLAIRPARTIFLITLVLLVTALSSASFAQPAQTVNLTIDAKAPGTPFPHYWEQMFGSGRAILSLRESYRSDLRTVKQATDFKYVRFHAIFHDETGFYKLDKDGKPIYNFLYIDQIYDGLLANGIRPFVELSFTPEALASDPKALHAFWYKQNVSPPRDYALWNAMVEKFVQHLVDRYGIDEVSQWYFEVWNEPNIDFWVGHPAQQTYFELYDNTARAVKHVDPRLRVGGPATAQAAWAGAFLDHCHQQHVPVDFVSTHVYGNDSAKDVFHSDESIPRDRMVCRAVAKVHDEIKSSPYPHTPLILSEFNASYANEPDVTDSVFMGPWMATTISQCDGLAEMISYWSFSDVFEEQGVAKTPFYGGYGLIAADNIPKPAFNAFAMFHHLGDTRLKSPSDSALVTRNADGSLVIALWNYTAPGQTGPSKHFALDIKEIPATATAHVSRLDATHGNVIATYEQMGRPAAPSLEQLQQLRTAAKPSPEQDQVLDHGRLDLDIPAQGLVVIEVK